MWGSILAALSSQIATTTDAIIVSNYVGPDAMSAINLVLPVLTIFSSLMILLGVGSSVVAAKAIGRRDDETANGVFTTCILTSAALGIFLAAIVYFYAPLIVEFLSRGNERIFHYGVSYLKTMCFGVTPMMILGVVSNFVKTDGNPRIVMYGVISGSLLNLCLDIIFIKVCGWGISGAAWATAINYVVAIAVCLFHFRSPYHSLKWNYDKSKFLSYIKQGVHQGFSMSLNTLLLAASMFAINSIILRNQGADGMYCWSVCTQIFLIVQMVLAGIGTSIYAIGGILTGEHDMDGLDILTQKSTLYIVSSLAAVMIFILLFPVTFGNFFGSSAEHSIDFLPTALRIFALLPIPYALIAQLRAVYQILGRNGLSLLLSVGQLILMVAFVWGFSFINPILLWWGFPISALTLLTLIAIYTLCLHFKDRDLRFFTLIPKHEDHPALNISVKMDEKDVVKAEKSLSDFLKEQNIDDLTTYEVRLACEELMNNIIHHTNNGHLKKHYFDLHVRADEKEINVLLKDDGRPFNPILKEEISKEEDASDQKLGLKIVNHITTSINYKYMYDQNVVLLTFNRN